MKCVIISADNFEDLELLLPYYRMIEEGIETDIASISRGKIKGKKGYEIEVDKTFEEINPEDYDILIIPGGKAPEAIRSNPIVKKIVKYFFGQDKLIAAICHGPQVLINAGLLKGKHSTCYPSVVEELKKAGAIYEDKEVVVDKNLITSRKPSDLPAFMREIIKKLR